MGFQILRPTNVMISMVLGSLDAHSAVSCQTECLGIGHSHPELWVPALHFADFRRVYVSAYRQADRSSLPASQRDLAFQAHIEGKGQSVAGLENPDAQETPLYTADPLLFETPRRRRSVHITERVSVVRTMNPGLGQGEKGLVEYLSLLSRCGQRMYLNL